MIASENKPVAAHTPELEPEFVIYTDASATGWGAISTSRGGNVIRISQPWSAEELEHYNVHSSVVAEPLAIRKAVAAPVPTSAKSVQIFTDHLPFVFAYKSTFGQRSGAVSQHLQHNLRCTVCSGGTKPGRCAQPREAPREPSATTNPHGDPRCRNAFEGKKGKGLWARRPQPSFRHITETRIHFNVLT